MPNLCIVCDREKQDSEEPWPSRHLCPGCHGFEEDHPRRPAQDYLDLDAGGFLLVALGHLVKAKEKLDQEPPSFATYHAKWCCETAANFVRNALRLLDEQKEETCEKP